jgi:DNA-binding response OmpR family regulator
MKIARNPGMELKAQPPSTTTVTPTGQVRVLVVEDDAPTGHALELLLKHHRYDVITARSVAEALDRLSSGPVPDAVLLDLMLPDGDGVRVLEMIQSRALPTKVTVVTGVGDPDRIERALTLKPHALLQKPVEFPEILKHLPPTLPA